LRAALGVSRYQLHQVRGIDGGVLSEADLQLAALAIDLRDAEALALKAELCGFEQLNGSVG
jgi:hypothetical protein